jgi:hypothetical protein
MDVHGFLLEIWLLGMPAPSDRGPPAAKFTLRLLSRATAAPRRTKKDKGSSQLHLVAALCETGANLGRNSLLHLNVSSAEAVCRALMFPNFPGAHG